MPQSKIKNAGTGTVIISSPDATATYTATSVTVTPNTLSNVTYTSGAGTSSPTWVNSNATGAISAKDVILDGVSLRQLLEERLNMMVPNPELEKEWEQLKNLGNEYRKLEEDLKEKARMWKALNKV